MRTFKCDFAGNIIADDKKKLFVRFAEQFRKCTFDISAGCAADQRPIIS